MLVIFTDGAQTQRSQRDRINPGDNAQNLKNKNVTIFTVGAGTPDPIELWSMATDENHIIFVQLEDLGRAVNRITERLCKIEVTVSRNGVITLQGYL